MTGQAMKDELIDKSEAVAGMIQLRNYDEIGDVLKSRKFVQGAFAIARQTPLMSDVLIMQDGEGHLDRRRVIAKLLDDNAVAGYRDRNLVPVMQRRLAEEARLHRGADSIVRTDLMPLVQRSAHQIAAALIGLDGVETVEATDRMIEQSRLITAGQTVDWSLEDKQTVIDRALKARAEFQRDFFDPSLARRKKLLAEARARGEDVNALGTDLLTLMLIHLDDVWKGDESILLQEVNGFIAGTTQTTALGFIVFVLRMERWFERHPEDRKLIGPESDFMQRAAFESLRLTVSPPARIRTATEDVTLSSGRVIKAGQSVAMYFVSANENEALFGEHPEEFNPRRQAPPGTAPWGIAFGAGAHACPGRPLITGSRNPMGKVGVDGTLVSMARLCYGAGMELDPERPPVRDPGTHYEIYTSVPVRFRNL